MSPLAELASIHDENGEHLAFSTPETRTIIAYILLLLLLEKEKKGKTMEIERMKEASEQQLLILPYGNKQKVKSVSEYNKS